MLSLISGNITNFGSKIFNNYLDASHYLCNIICLLCLYPLGFIVVCLRGMCTVFYDHACLHYIVTLMYKVS